MQFNQANVLRWMRTHATEHKDGETGEVNMTSLVESAADAFNQNDIDGPLDDEHHWIWELATKVA